MFQNIIISAVLIVMLCLLSEISMAQDEYTSEVLYTISWGNEPGCISSDFKTIGYIGDKEIFEPGPWTMTNSGQLVIIEASSSGGHIMKFSSAGEFICRSNIGSIREIATLQNGTTVLSGKKVPEQIYLMDSDFNITYEILLPFDETYTLFQITPSTTNNSFWLAFLVLEEINGAKYQQFYKTEIFQDGTYSTPELTWDDVNNTGIPSKFISPTGNPCLMTADMFGDLYSTGYDDGNSILRKWRLNQQGTEYVEVFTHVSASDPGWEIFEMAQNTGPRHFVTWEGDFYTIHATDNGIVLTKYTLQHE